MGIERGKSLSRHTNSEKKLRFLFITGDPLFQKKTRARSFDPSIEVKRLKPVELKVGVLDLQLCGELHRLTVDLSR
jgi:hypothetical protein